MFNQMCVHLHQAIVKIGKYLEMMVGGISAKKYLEVFLLWGKGGMTLQCSHVEYVK